VAKSYVRRPDRRRTFSAYGMTSDWDLGDSHRNFAEARRKSLSGYDRKWVYVMTDTSSGTSQSAPVWPIQTFAAGMKPFRHRVRVLTEVINVMDEIAVITATFQSMGWIVRPANKSEVRGYPATNRAWLVVEVRFNGYPRTAPKVAVKRIDEIVERFQLGVWVRYAEIIRFSQGPEKTYYIDEMPAGWLTRRSLLSRGLKRVGIPRIIGLFRLPLDFRTFAGCRDERGQFRVPGPA
jgi:hypothetical protein